MCSIIYYGNVNADTIYLQFPQLYYAQYIPSSNLCSCTTDHIGATVGGSKYI